MERLIINYIAAEKRYAFLKDNHAEKIYIQQPEQQSLVGNIYYGTVTKVLPGMNAAFVDIGVDKHAYLHRDKLVSFVLSDEERSKKENKSVSSFVHQGEKLIVQVEKDETGSKGARLTGIIELAGEDIIFMPHGRYIAVSKKIEEASKASELRKIGNDLKEKFEGLIFRTSAAERSEEVLALELRKLREQYHDILQTAQSFKKPGIIMQKDTFLEEVLRVIAKMKAGEVMVDDQDFKRKLQIELGESSSTNITYFNGKEGIFTAFRLEHEVEKALKRMVWLENGAYLIFDETEALTIIDVNTGKFSGKINLQDTVKKTNNLAAAEALRQIRLRDIGGIILIDFIDMKHESDRDELYQKVVRDLKKDERQSKVIGFTPLGVLQLTRKKTRPSLLEALTQKCPVCEGTGRLLSAESVAYKLERELWEYRQSDFTEIYVETTPDVKNIITGSDQVHLKRLETALGLKIKLKVIQSDKHFYVIKKMGESS